MLNIRLFHSIVEAQLTEQKVGSMPTPSEFSWNNTLLAPWMDHSLYKYSPGPSYAPELSPNWTPGTSAHQCVLPLMNDMVAVDTSYGSRPTVVNTSTDHPPVNTNHPMPSLVNDAATMDTRCGSGPTIVNTSMDHPPTNMNQPAPPLVNNTIVENAMHSGCLMNDNHVVTHTFQGLHPFMNANHDHSGLSGAFAWTNFAASGNMNMALQISNMVHAEGWPPFANFNNFNPDFAPLSAIDLFNFDHFNSSHGNVQLNVLNLANMLNASRLAAPNNNLHGSHPGQQLTLSMHQGTDANLDSTLQGYVPLRNTNIEAPQHMVPPCAHTSISDANQVPVPHYMQVGMYDDTNSMAASILYSLEPSTNASLLGTYVDTSQTSRPTIFQEATTTPSTSSIGPEDPLPATGAVSTKQKHREQAAGLPKRQSTCLEA